MTTYEFYFCTDGLLASIFVHSAGITTMNLYYASAAVNPPFGSVDSTYAGITTSQLAIIAPAATGVPHASPTTTTAGSYVFSYDSSGGGTPTSASELTQVVFPWGGPLRWEYQNVTYAYNTGTTRLLREVRNRYLAADSAGATEWTYPFTHSDDGTTIAVVHADTKIADPSGVGAKKWTFITSSSSAWQVGLTSGFTQLTSATGTALTDDTYVWAQTGGITSPLFTGSNPYISQKTSVSDGTTSVLTTQTLDVYGNISEADIYPSYTTTVPTTPVKKYENTYLNDSSHVSYYVLNRLTDVKLTAGSTVVHPVVNHYETSGSTLACSTSQPCPTTQYDATPPVPLAYRGVLASSDTLSKTTTNVYYMYGALYSSTGTDGSSLYNTISSTTNVTAPDAISTQSYSTSPAYDSWLGVTTTTGANGEQMYMTYDTYGRPATATSPYGTYGSPTETYAYSSAGTLPAWQTETGSNGYTKTTLDGLGRPIKIERGTSSGSIQAVTDTVYYPCACSPLAKLQKTSVPHASGATPVWTTYTYDGIGRTLTVQQPDGASTTHYSYVGNQTTVIDPKGTTTNGPDGSWKTFTKDVEGNLTTVLEPDPSAPTTATLTTSYTYDWMGHLAASTMTRGGTTQTRTFAYDTHGRLTSATNPENGTVTYTYNTDNTLATKTDAKSQVASYSYDSQKRVTALSYSGDPCKAVAYTYGTDPTVYNYNRLKTITYGALSGGPYYDSNGLGGTCTPGANATQYVETYTYHRAGGVTNKNVHVSRRNLDSDLNIVTNEADMSVSYSYYYDGRLASMTYPLGVVSGWGVYVPVTFSYGYDGMGRPATLTDNAGTFNTSGLNTTWVQGVAYDAAGNMTNMQHYQNTTTDCSGTVFTNNLATDVMTYNPNEQLLTKNFSSSWLSCSTPTSKSGSASYTYSTTKNDGKITSMTDAMAGGTGEDITYTYDALKRLTQAASVPHTGSTPAAWTQDFGYDGFGNMTSKVLNSGANTIPSIDSSTNRFQGTGLYDLNGNMTSGMGATLTYDEANRVASANPGSGNQYYRYAPDNKRIYLENSTGNEQWTLYGAHGENLGIYYWQDSSGTGDCPCTLGVAGGNVWFAGKLIWGYFQAINADRVGSNRADGERYLPYGEEITSTADGPPKFGTYTRDGYTKFDYADQRYYASAYGRFNTADPAMSSGSPIDPGSLNRYSYVGGDPVNNNDPREAYVRTGFQRQLVGQPRNGRRKLHSRILGTERVHNIRLGWRMFAPAGTYYNDQWFMLPPAPDSLLPRAENTGGCGAPGDDAPPPGGSSGGGGGGTGIPGPSITSASQAKGLLSTALSLWKNCDKVLGQGAVNYAGQLTFADGGSPGNGRLAQSEVTNGIPNGNVTLFVNFYGNPAQGAYRSATEEAETLVHELIHSFFKLTGDHQNIIDKFHIPLANGQDKSTAIDNWIGRDCQ